MIVVWPFLDVPWVCLQFVIGVFPDHNHFYDTIPFSYMYWDTGFTVVLTIKLAQHIVLLLNKEIPTVRS